MPLPTRPGETFPPCFIFTCSPGPDLFIQRHYLERQPAAEFSPSITPVCTNSYIGPQLSGPLGTQCGAAVANLSLADRVTTGHFKHNHFTSKQSAIGPGRNSHPLSSETANAIYTFLKTLPASLSHLNPACHSDPSQLIPLYTYILSSVVACTCCVPANHTRSQ